MNKKISNDENIRNLKIRKILRIIIITFALITMGLSFASIIFNISLLFPILSFIITHILMRIKEKIPINKQDDLSDVRKLLNKNKKK